MILCNKTRAGLVSERNMPLKVITVRKVHVLIFTTHKFLSETTGKLLLLF